MKYLDLNQYSQNNLGMLELTIERTFNRKPEFGLSIFVSHLISSSSSSLGDMTVTVDALLGFISMLALGILGDGSGVGRGVGRGVGSGVGSSRIGDKHLLIPLGTSRSMDGG